MQFLKLGILALGLSALCGACEGGNGGREDDTESDAGAVSGDTTSGTDTADTEHQGDTGDMTSTDDTDDAGVDGGSSSKLTPATLPSGIRLSFDAVIYRDGQSVDLTLDMGPYSLSDDVVEIIVATKSTADAERVTLVKGEDNVYTATDAFTVLSKDQGEALNGSLEVAPGAMFHALFALDKSRAELAAVPEDIVTDTALMEDASGAAIREKIDVQVALSTDETDPPEGAKPVGTLVTEGGQPVQLATHELILYTWQNEELNRFLDISGGTLLESLDLESDDDREWKAHLVEVDPSAADAEHLPMLRDIFGDSGDFLVSNEGVLGIWTLALTYQIDGFLVSVNPRLQMQGAPVLGEPEASEVTHTMSLVTPPAVADTCVPNDPDRPCVENVPAVWAFAALWEADARRINAAVLDMGFAPNDDFRTPVGEEMIQCDMTADRRPVCEPGAAEGPPTVGNSFFGGRSWHGTGVTSTLAAKVNNGFGAAGVAGQVAVPMLYKYDTEAYVFEIGRGIEMALDDGASVINISGGYPCTILTDFGPDFDICSPGGRAGICGIITASLVGAAAIACAIPTLTGLILCAALTATAVAASATCLSTLAFGNLRSPMTSAVERATELGVPVVTIAGNVIRADSLPSIVDSIVDFGDNRTEAWGIIPAMVPDTIVVAAVNDSLDNVHFHGDRVDLWAPISSTYYAPSDVSDPESELTDYTLGGTSAAAPYVAGVIAMMQAVNPSLDRREAPLADRPGIVSRIRDIITADENTFSNDELVDLGYTDQPDVRRRLVNPLAAVQAAAEGVIPDIEAMGYDTTLNYSELLGTDDTSSDATPLDFDTWTTGTILSIPGTEGVSTPVDEDWYSVTFGSSPAGRVWDAEITLLYPFEYGTLFVTGTNGNQGCFTTAGSEEVTKTCHLLAMSGTGAQISVTAHSDNDNVYRLRVAEPVLATPVLEIVEPSSGATVCAGDSVTLRAKATFPTLDPEEFSVPSSSIYWKNGSATIGSGNPRSATFTEGSHSLTVHAYGDTFAASDPASVTAIDCVGEPPVATITTPATDLLDPGVDVEYWDDEMETWCADVSLAGSATDPEDGALTGGSLVWTTDRTDIQDAALGTGTSLTAKLCTYNGSCCETHTVTLVATDSNGNPSAPVSRQIYIWTMI